MDLSCLSEKILINDEKIIAMDVINGKNQIALITANNVCRLSLKVFDVQKADFVSITALDDFHVNPTDSNLFSDANRSSDNFYSFSLYLHDKILCRVNKFNSLSNNNFLFKPEN